MKIQDFIANESLSNNDLFLCRKIAIMERWSKNSELPKDITIMTALLMRKAISDISRSFLMTGTPTI